MKSGKAGLVSRGLFKLWFGSTDYVRRILNSLDQAAKSARGDYAESLYGSDAMRQAGFSNSDIGRLVESVAVVKERAYEDAIAAGMSPLDAKLHGMDSARDALQKGLSEKIGETEMKELQRAVRNEADLIVGHDPTHISEGLISNIFPNKFIDAVARWRSDPNPATRIASTALFGLVTIPYRMLRYSASFSPYGLVRYSIHKFRTSKGHSSLWEQSLGTRYQERQRLTEAIVGSALMGGLLAMFKPTRDDKDNDRDSFFIHVTGAGPGNEDRLVQDAWRKRHHQFSLEVKIGGHEFHTPYGRGAGEAFLFPLSFVGAYDDHLLKSRQNEGRRQPSAISMTTSMAANYLSTMSQRGAFIGLKNAGDLISRTTTSRAPGVASIVASNAANFIPWNRFMQTVGNFFADTPDRSSVGAAILANTPVAGPIFARPALNGLGDHIGDESVWNEAFFAGAPVVMKLEDTPLNKRVYGLIREKEQAPSTPLRSVIEKRYRTLSDDEWYSFMKRTGAEVKTTMNLEYPSLKSMDPAEFNKTVNGYSVKAQENAAEALGLSRKK